MAFDIHCAQCGRPVDKWEQFERQDDCSIVFKAWCHGEMDTCELDRFFLVEGLVKIIRASAFSAQRITT